LNLIVGVRVKETSFTFVRLIVDFLVDDFELYLKVLETAW